MGTYAHRLEQVLSLLVDIEHTSLAVLREIERRHLRDVLVLALALLLLQLEGDAADGTALDALHQVGGVAGDLSQNPLSAPRIPAQLLSMFSAAAYLVPQSLARDNSNLVTDPLVGLEVEGEARVVALDDDLGGLLDGLGPDATHDCGVAGKESGLVGEREGCRGRRCVLSVLPKIVRAQSCWRSKFAECQAHTNLEGESARFHRRDGCLRQRDLHYVRWSV